MENPWTILSEKLVYDNPWISVTEFDVIQPGGGKGIYGKVHFKNLAIGVIPMDEEGNIYLVGQYRFPLNQYSWEIPEGGGALSVPAIDSAKRELQEETGLTASRWDELITLHLSNSVSDEYGIVYLARGLQQGKASPEETEDLQVKKMHVEEVYQMVINGSITDSLTVCGILRLKLFLHEENSGISK
ncbi:NUDIX hydrolase [Pollutibacter soli]|uniref:NUDIX hydrolase n=1 Tax=Pollutibacter soli TaxID=3034157 RepID=UPI0030139F55